MQCKLEDYDLPTYSAIVDKARQLETNRQRMQGNWAHKGETSRRFPANNADKRKMMAKGPIGTRSIPGSSAALRCWKCGQGHLPSRCEQLQGKCCLCGDEKHRAKECPRAKCRSCGRKGHTEHFCKRKDSQATARVFALEGTEAGLEDLDKEGGTEMDWMEDLDEEDLHDMITGEDE